MKILKLLLVLIVLTVLTSCSSGNSDKKISELISHFQGHGFFGKEIPKAFTLAGAIDGVGYVGDEFRLEVYKYEKIENIPHQITYKNGNFGMVISKFPEEGKEKLIEAFQSFGITEITSTQKEKAEESIAVEKTIESEVAKLLIIYNKMIADVKKKGQSVEVSDKMFWNTTDYPWIRDNQWRQNTWNESIVKYDVDSIKTSFKSRFGENKFDELTLSLQDYVDEKVNRKIYGPTNAWGFPNFDIVDNFTPFVDGESIRELPKSKPVSPLELAGAILEADGVIKVEPEVVEMITEEETITEIEDIVDIKEIKYFKINVDDLRVRTSPELDSDNVEKLDGDVLVEYMNEKSTNQTTVTIKDTETTEYWYKVRTPNGNVGWIHGCCFEELSN